MILAVKLCRPLESRRSIASSSRQPTYVVLNLHAALCLAPPPTMKPASPTVGKHCVAIATSERNPALSPGILERCNGVRIFVGVRCTGGKPAKAEQNRKRRLNSHLPRSMILRVPPVVASSA